jgi:hypothetical protein
VTPSDWAAVLTAIAGCFGVFGAGIRWYLIRIDTRASAELDRRDKLRAEEIERQDELREELRSDMQRRIDELLKTVNLQRALINGYMRHVKALEKMMIKAGLEPPDIDLDELLRELP